LVPASRLVGSFRALGLILWVIRPIRKLTVMESSPIGAVSEW
jgi:hypothetical protein